MKVIFALVSYAPGKLGLYSFAVTKETEHRYYVDNGKTVMIYGGAHTYATYLEKKDIVDNVFTEFEPAVAKMLRVIDRQIETHANAIATLKGNKEYLNGLTVDNWLDRINADRKAELIDLLKGD